MSIASRCVTMIDIVSERLTFAVPIYQRLYVWGDEQVATLLDDLWTAFVEGKELYYLGTTLVMERKEGDGRSVLELIDGQQRFTTLWLMSHAWEGPLAPFRKDAAGHPRVVFDIRPQVDDFLSSYEPGRVGHVKEASRMEDALARIEQFLTSDPGRRARSSDFLGFVYESACLVLTSVPEGTDLNKLFEVMNSRGAQLQHHEILKARLLRTLDGSEKAAHARLWEACAEMDSYVEESLRDVAQLDASRLVPQGAPECLDEALRTGASIVRQLARRAGQAGDGTSRTLESIVSAAPDESSSSGASPASTSDATEPRDGVHSIVGFPVLLQHALRVWLAERDRPDLPKIDDKELLQLFALHGPKASDDVTSFLETLWELRWTFDSWVVKRVKDADDEWLALARPSLRDDESSGRRIERDPPQATTELSLLQSMLFHSRERATQYWLSPYLAYVRRHRPDEQGALRYLQHLDNHLHCRAEDQGEEAGEGEGQSEASARRFTWATRTLEFMHDTPSKWHRAELSCNILRDQRLGTRFPHYWFYKLEHVLWRRWRHQCPTFLKSEKLARFRLVSLNSVEHVSPQTPEEHDAYPVSEAVLHAFGNLALVSRSQNSEYSNRTFTTKQRIWLERLERRRHVPDSLKLAHVYSHDTWGDGPASAHQQLMVELVQSYLDEDFHAPSSGEPPCDVQPLGTRARRDQTSPA